jgi:hypothetical protein
MCCWVLLLTGIASLGKLCSYTQAHADRLHMHLVLTSPSKGPPDCLAARWWTFQSRHQTHMYQCLQTTSENTRSQCKQDRGLHISVAAPSYACQQTLHMVEPLTACTCICGDDAGCRADFPDPAVLHFACGSHTCKCMHGMWCTDLHVAVIAKCRTRYVAHIPDCPTQGNPLYSRSQHPGVC